MTLIAVPIFVDDAAAVNDALAAAADAAAGGAAMVEWRVDRLSDAEAGAAVIARLLAGSPLPAIVTCRSVAEGGFAEDREGAMALLAAAARADAPPRYVDLELAVAGDPAAAAVIDAVAGSEDTGLLLSAHDFGGRPADLLQRIERMSAHPHAAVVKVAWMARSLRDNLEAFDLLRDRRAPTIALCMGPFGLLSRVLAPKFGGLITFASAQSGAQSAPGQPTLEDLDRCGFDRVSPSTRVYGVIGWPIGHSRGPTLHNAVFRRLQWDGVYLPLPVPAEWEHFKATIGSLLDHPALDFRGASVTLPHKTHLVRFVRERGGTVEPEAEAIGAANTLIVDPGGTLACANTDASALRETLLEGMKLDTLVGRRVLVLGAGGVARAAAFVAAAAGARVTVAARRPERARALVDDLAAGTLEARGTGELGGERYDAVINATPVGMTGGSDPSASPLPATVPIDDGVTVLDTVYAPPITPLLEDAATRGAAIVTGEEMFVRQAAAQCRRWTGHAEPLPLYRDAAGD